MNKYFVDTNVFLRFLLNDHPQFSSSATSLFKRSEMGKINLWTSDMVVAELVWTLESYYKYSKKGICESLTNLLSLKGLSVDNRTLILTALDLYKDKNVDFIDAYSFLTAKLQNIKIISFDHDFDKLGQRIDPTKL
jgi:uncharacterized protein